MPKKLFTEEFLARAKVTHGSRYNYSKVQYKSTRTEVCITCQIHGDFFQTPNSHLRGRGCPKCNIDKRFMKQESFVEKATIVHKGLYGYEKTVYNGNREKAVITCFVHGDFLQTPNSHLKGAGCLKCARDKIRSSTEEFVKKAVKVHGNGYDYSRVDYRSQKEKVRIVCRKHGEFSQEPSRHLRGCGCGECHVDNTKLSLDDFLSRSKNAHGLVTYDYSKVLFLKGSKDKVCIICPTHGEFIQEAGSHVSGRGCPKCGFDRLSKDRAMSQEEFIRRATKFHGAVYDYSNVKYVNGLADVTIVCPTHGEFKQEARTHLRTRGCPLCKLPLGERAILTWLKTNKVEFNRCHSYPDLMSPFGTPLKFDFFIKQNKCLVEYDGEQHFRPVRFNSKSEKAAVATFERSRRYDALKNRYCVENNIPLLRISYKEYKSIPEILFSKLQFGIDNRKSFVNEMTPEQLSLYYVENA